MLPEPVTWPDPAPFLPVVNASAIFVLKNLCLSEAVVLGPGLLLASLELAVCDATTESIVTE